MLIKLDISTELNKITVSANYKVKPGKYKIQVTIYTDTDEFYKTEADITIKDREKHNNLDWDEQRIYFAVTDRFNDGDSTNDEPTNGGSTNEDKSNDGVDNEDSEVEASRDEKFISDEARSTKEGSANNETAVEKEKGNKLEKTETNSKFDKAKKPDDKKGSSYSIKEDDMDTKDDNKVKYIVLASTLGLAILGLLAFWTIKNKIAY